MKPAIRNKKRNMITSIVTGCAITLLLLGLGAIVISLLLYKEALPDSSMGLSVFLVQFVAMLTGTVVAAKKQGEKLAMLCGCTGLFASMLMLLTTTLFFSCEFSRVGWGMLACLSGVICGCIITMITGKKHKRKVKNW